MQTGRHTKNRATGAALGMALAFAALACGGPQMQVQFLTVPRAVESIHPESCRLFSRSPIAHIIRLSLTPEQDGRRARIDNAVIKVTVSNEARGLLLASVDIKPDGTPQEVSLEGPVDEGDQLKVVGAFSVNGDTREFSETCLVD